MENKTYICESDGSVFVDGHEDAVKEFLTKHRGVKQNTKELDAGKVSFRNLAKGILQLAGEGARSVFFRDGGRSGLTVSQPDYTKEGNRSDIKPPLMKKFNTLGGLAALGTEDAELFDRSTEKVGPHIILTGEVAAWFKQNYLIPGKMNHLLDCIQDNPGGSTTQTRLNPTVIPKLRLLAVMGENKAKEAAQLLLDKGLKTMTVLTPKDE